MITAKGSPEAGGEANVMKRDAPRLLGTDRETGNGQRRASRGGANHTHSLRLRHGAARVWGRRRTCGDDVVPMHENGRLTWLMAYDAP
eukprot:982947-Prymnesium_polylepis.1